MRLRTAALAALPVLAAAAVAKSRFAPRIGDAALRGVAALEARQAKLRTRTVDVAGLPMAIFEGGPAGAPTLVLLHGFSADRGIWVRFAAHFVRDFHVVIPDLAGHGETPFDAVADHSVTAQADRVAALLDALGVEKAHVIGNSMGGAVAAWFAIAHSERTRSLGLCDALGVKSPQRSDLEGVLDEGRNPFLLDDTAQFDGFYAMAMARPPFTPRFARHAMARGYVTRRDQLERMFAEIQPGHPLDERLGEITAPTLVLWGAQDRLLHVSAVGVWAAGIPDVRTIVYDDAGHMPMIEFPKRTARDYRAFLDSL
ncbi:MAG TPA: alpha/beta fold hydrolase [Jatrophihabitans sp.]|jgi:pimeloyl-ACP methyl ester carboxylesterase|uniref:alpha/beta fold hydrolase n=1 Tax=Jatrophihabitans sp. TaxID=1932789 RepID=UPI002E0C2D44|nr:alpha/beta fold hydrolase [Jatrophihabitans sp.]